MNNGMSQLFFTYKPEKNVLYVSPTISTNYGYILPIPNRCLNGNTYTFIYKQTPSCNMFIAPISRRNQFSKAFLSYKKYNKKLRKYLNSKQTISHKNIIKIPKQFNLEKKPHIHGDLDKVNKVNKVNKIMEIFDISHFY